MLWPLLTGFTNGYAGSSCTFGGLDQNSWMNINILLVLVVFLLGALVYSLSTLFPVSMGERLRGASRYEMINGLVSLIIIGILISFAVATCQVGSQLVGTATGYQNPIQYGQVYIGTLLFQRSTALFTQIYSESLALLFWGNVMDQIESVISGTITAFVQIEPGFNVISVFFGFSSVLTATYSGLIAITFGVLFVIYILLPLVGSIALTVLVPISIIIRSIPFAGPRLRETADTFLAIAIAFYFILPLTILLNFSLMNWLYTPCAAGQTNCNPNYEYLQPYNLLSIPIDSLFTQQTFNVGGPLNIQAPESFLGGGIGGQGGLLSAVANGFSTLVRLPAVIVTFGESLATYLFESIVLIALDLAITVGFAQGLVKALASISRLVSTGPVWGSQ